MSNQAQALTRDMGGSGSFSTSQMIIMLLLADHADEKWSCFPSVDLLMHHSQLKERTVRECLKQLSAKGVLAVLQQRSKSTGAQLPNRYVLNEKVIGEYASIGKAKWAAIKAKKSARKHDIRSGQATDETSPDGFMVDGPSYGVLVQAPTWGASAAPHSDPHVSAPAFPAPHQPASAAPHSDPHVSAPAFPGPRGEGVHETAGWGAGNCKNSEVPLKGTRADLTINRKSSSEPRDERKKFEPIATPVLDETIDDDLNSVSGEVNDHARQQSNLYRAVDLDELFQKIPEKFRSLNVAQVTAMIDVVLNRAGARRVARPTAYVLKAINDDPWGLLADIQSVTMTPQTAPHITDKPASVSFAEAPKHEAGVVAFCDVHEWQNVNPQAICPSCQANFLSGQSHLNVDADGNPRSGKPQAGWFRYDMKINDDTELVGVVATPSYGADEEPPF